MVESQVGPWARKKLSYLKKYLDAYSTILYRTRFKYYYIDAFAGPGSHVVRRGASEPGQMLLEGIAGYASGTNEQREFLVGSPRIALASSRPFSGYVFIERSRERAGALAKLVTEFGNERSIVIEQGDCNAYLQGRVAARGSSFWRDKRAIVFLDPFGMQVPWETIVALASTKAVEVLLNFPVGMAIQRLMTRRAHRIPAAWREGLDRFFGTGEWHDIVYKSERTLFGDIEESRVNRSGVKLLHWYRERLRGHFAHVSGGALIRNTRGSELYFLLHATHNSTGAKIAKHILAAGEVVE